MTAPERAYREVLLGIENAAAAAGRPGGARLLAVSKTHQAADIRGLAALGQRAFGENYVQEAVAKQDAVADLGLQWHLIGHLQSNKAREAAQRFDWVHTLDRPRIAEALSRHRPQTLPPLNVLLQVNIDEETSKSGCAPDAVEALAEVVAMLPRLRLRGLMAIASPDPDIRQRRAAFRRMKALFDALTVRHPGADTLSMGMSEDYLLAIEQGATLVRIGTALFGPRSRESGVGSRESEW